MLETLKGKLWRWRFWLLIIGILIVIIWVGFNPWNVAGLTSQPHPAQSYAEAVQRIEALRAQEAPDMNPVCHLQFLTHNQKAERVIVFVHGYTNCPQQFQALGQRFYELGYNVLLAPMPHHGLADRMTEALSEFRAEELIIYADAITDIAQGLGEQVVMVGLSGGGVTTAWVAQNRNDLDLAVIISPVFGYAQIPTPLTAGVMNLYQALPNSFQWWDPALQENNVPVYAYPRYSTRALAEFLRVGFSVQAAARQGPPAAHSLLVVTNANDMAINNTLVMQVVKDWRAHGASLTTYEFEAGLKLGHDLIDPNQPDAQIDVVYPQLIKLITQ